MKDILEKSVVKIFNTFQNYVAENVIPQIIESFDKSGYEIDENTFFQFFENIETFDEISKYFSEMDTELKMASYQLPASINNKKDEECDYINTRGENKGKKCVNPATDNKEGHPRCNKHKNNAIQEKPTMQFKNSKSKSKNDNEKPSKTVSKKTNDDEIKQSASDIKTLLAKIKAAKEQQKLTKNRQLNEQEDDE